MSSDFIAELQKQYLDGFEKKLSDLEEALKNKDTEKLIDIFHKLAGSGNTYKMPEVSELGFAAEKKLHEGFDHRAIKDFIDQLRQIYLKFKK